MKFKKLDMRGFSHEVIIIAFVAIFAIVGVGFLVASHAQTPRCVDRTFSQGSGGHCVKDLQVGARLWKGAPHNLKVDGIYGSGTTAAIKQIQGYRKIRVDGAVGPQTWRNVICWSLWTEGSKARPYFNDSGCNQIKWGLSG